MPEYQEEAGAGQVQSSHRFAHHFLRLLVFPQSDKNRLSQLPVASPFRELDLTNKNRIHPFDLPHHPRRYPLHPLPALLRRQIRERAVVPLFRLQLLVQRGEKLGVEAGSHYAGEEQPVLLVIANQQGAEVFSRALRWREATDDELLLAHAFEFDPRATPSARFVSRSALFTDHSLQPQSLHFPQECVRIPSDLT